MPIYEYTCQRCGHEFEQMVCMSRRDAVDACPICGIDAVERKISVFAASPGSPDPAPPTGCGRCGPGSCAGGGW